MTDGGSADPSACAALQVLVVDDNRDAADSLCLLLRSWGYAAQAKYDGDAGLQAAVALRPHCIMLDLGMPGLDGYSVARQVRELPGLRTVKLVALTAYSEEWYVRQALEAGFHHYLVKPADPLEIRRVLTMLEAVLRLAEKTGELAQQNMALARETKELIREVKQEVRDVKEEVRELKEELREIKDGERDIRP